MPFKDPLSLVAFESTFVSTRAKCNNTLQILVHNQGFEVLCRNCFVFTREFGELIYRQNPNEVIDPQVVNDFIIDPSSYDPLEGDLIRCFNNVTGDYDYVYIH